jgi:hypothetical protein
MDTSEVYNHLQHLPVHSFGVYASDLLPRKIAPSTAIVVNTDPHTHQGTHWVAFYLDLHGQLEYFDSYGQPPTVPDHIKFIRRNSCCYTYNSTPLQSLYSSVCGHYCLCFLYCRAHYNMKMVDFVRSFDESRQKNDIFVSKLFDTLYL